MAPALLRNMARGMTMSDQADRYGEQKVAESDVEGFRENLGPFVVAAETTRMPMVFSNAKVQDNPIVFVNQAFLDLTGYGEQEVLGQKFDFLILERHRSRGAGGKSRPPSRAAARPRYACPFQSQGRRHGLGLRLHQSGTGRYRHRRAALRLVLRHHEARAGTRTAAVPCSTNSTTARRTRLRRSWRLPCRRCAAWRTSRPSTPSKGRILALSKTHSLLGAENWDRGRPAGCPRTVRWTHLGAACERVSIEGPAVRLFGRRRRCPSLWHSMSWPIER